MELNAQQSEAVRHAKGPLLVVAGAGSGKTRVIVHRIAHLIEKQNVHPTNLLAVTFTNKAAGEMRYRLEVMLGVKARDLWIATFHATCLRILRQHSVEVGYGPHFQIFDDSAQLTLIKECLKELNLSERLTSPESALNCISRAKDICQDPADYESTADNFYKENVARIYKRYQRRLLEVQAVDFGDLIRLAADLLKRCPEILSVYQKRFKHVLVDEYQDTNHAQYRFIEQLVRTHKNICVVGDEDQSVYRWRGADISNILRFEKDFAPATVIRLEQNYRSTKTIISAAGCVIANNTERKAKTLWTNNPDGESLKIIASPSERGEAEGLADEIRNLRGQGYKLNDIAVFYRTNAQSRPIEEIFLQESIPHKIFGGIRFYERMEIKDIIAYLRLIVESKDDVSFARIVNTPARGIGKETIKRLRDFAFQQGMSLYEAIRDFSGKDIVRSNVSKKLINFYEMMEELRTNALNRPLSELLQDVLEKTGYVESLIAKNTIEAQDRIENINELVAATQEFEPEEESLPLIQFLDQVALISNIDNWDENADAVTLMTAHLAKGLEFDVVFMVGMEEGLFPHVKSIDDPEELEEERRLCYVGMTRARKRLFLSHAFRRQLFGSTRYSVVSRFVDEIPEEYVESVIARSNGDKAIPQKTWDRHVALRAPRDDESQVTSHESRNFDFDQRPSEERLGAFAKGTRVSHPVFGMGFIKRCEPTSAGHKVTVQFKNGALKRLIAERAGLTFL